MTALRIPLIMTRPEGSNARFVDAIPQTLRARFHVVISPLIDIAALDVKPDVGPNDAVIFTSANGVRFAPQGQGRNAYCVGDATSRAAAKNGWHSRCLGETSDDLVAELVAMAPTAKMWHLSGVHTRGNVAEKLAAAGMQATRAPLYDQKLMPLSSEAVSVLTMGSPVIAPIFSPRTARQFARICPKNAQPFLLALSAAVAAPLDVLTAAEVEISTAPNVQAMQEGLEKLATRLSLG